MKYRKKPVVIDAMQLTKRTAYDVIDFVGMENLDGYNTGETNGDPCCVYIKTLEGRMRGNEYDYIIRGIKGEFYPCKPDIFEATYEPVEQK